VKKILSIILLVIIGSAGSILGFLYFTAPKPIVPFVHDPGDYFVTDIRGGKSLLKTDIIIQMRDNRVQAEITARNHQIRNDIIFILRGKTEEELKAPGIEAALNQEIIAKLGADFDSQDFLQIYFNEFVIQ